MKMNQKTMEVGTTTSVLALVIGVFLLSFMAVMAAPNNAQAFWWKWWKPAHAQENEHATSTVTVTIKKYIDGNPATTESADGLSFPMNASWNDPEGIGEDSGSFELSADNSYMTETVEMQKSADYSTNERLNEVNVGADCSEDKPYALVGYTTGTTSAAAEAQTPTTTAPAMTNLSDDMHVIVWNEKCGNDEEPNPSGDLVGEVTGGSDGDDPGELAVTSIDAEKTTAVANGTFEDGWRYVFNITVPTDEPNLSMKFDDWLHTNGTNTIPVANNVRISSDQADNSGATVLLTAADTYSSPELTMVDDLDNEEGGIQVQVLVEVAVPANTLNGTYSTDYGVQSLE